MMKRKITGIAAALITATAATITASAEYYIGTEQDGNAVKVEIVADGATLPAIEFTVEMPEDVEIDDIDTISGAFFNEDSGIYAWAGAEAPEDGAVMFSATFIVEDGYEGEFSVTPAEGYENDMPVTLTAEIVGEDGETDDDTEDEETMEDILPKQISDIFAPTEEICKKYPSDEWFMEAGEPPVKPWYTIQDMAYKKGLIKDGYIGKCKYMFFDIWDVVSIYRKELETNPFKLYGLE